MKKYYLSLVMVIGFMTASFALAAPQVTASTSNGYFSAQHSQPSKGSIKAANLVPPTDITIINASNDFIVASVIDTTFSTTIYSDSNDHIRNYEYAGMTPIALRGPYGSSFFTRNVCRYAVLTVYGQPGSYRVNVDSEYCN